MQEGSGSFYCFVPRSPALWLLSRTKSDKLVHQKLDSVLSSWDDDKSVGSGNECASPASLARQASLPQTQSYVYKGAGLSVKLGLEEVATDLFRVKPYVYSSPSNSAVIVFSGHLTNLSELLRRNGKGSNPASPSYSGDVNNASTLERKSSIERSLDLGATTASLVLNLYLDGQRDDEEVIMLSELQGEYSFVIYDHKRRQAFAARDPSGDEPLYYHISEDGDVSFSGSRLAVPDGEQPHEWRELPPGHYISGKNPKLHQFALTPTQLAMREIQQEDELGSSFRAVKYGTRPSLLTALGPDEEQQLAAQLSHRTSLDNDRSIRRRSLDADVFSLDL
jgi:hypothetical protein